MNRSEKTEKRGFSTLRFLLSVLIITVGFTTFFVIKNSENFSIKQVKVSSDYQHVSKKQLQAIIGDELKNKNFFTLSMKQLKKHLLSIPWVYDVSIQRSWPDELTIKIIEQTPLARWNQTRIINKTDEVFQPRLSSIPAQLPHIHSPENTLLKALAYYKNMNKALAPFALTITDLHLGKRGGLKMVLNNGTTLLLGRQHIQKRWRRFITVCPKLFTHKKNNIKRIDFRYSNGFAVKRF